eukprot:3474238-Amphidinium_carterae.1
MHSAKFACQAGPTQLVNTVLGRDEDAGIKTLGRNMRGQLTHDILAIETGIVAIVVGVKIEKNIAGPRS